MADIEKVRKALNITARCIIIAMVVAIVALSVSNCSKSHKITKLKYQLELAKHND